MKIPSQIAAAAAILALVLAPAAAAHVTVQPERAPAGGFTRLDVRVPTERDNASTTKVEVQSRTGYHGVDGAGARLDR